MAVEYLCSQSYLVVVNRTSNESAWHLTECFDSLVIITPIYSLLALVSALMIGWTSGLIHSLPLVYNMWFERLLIVKSALMSIILAVITVETIVSSTEATQTRAYYMSRSIQTISLVLYLTNLLSAAKRKSFVRSGRLNAILILIVLSSANQLYTMVAKQDYRTHQITVAAIVLFLWSVGLAINILLSTKLKPSNEDQTLLLASEHISMISDSNSEIQLMGDQSANIISKLLLVWVSPLMTRGVQRKIGSHNDLFVLPKQINSMTVFGRFESVFNMNPTTDGLQTDARTKSLLKSLFRCYGFELLVVGCLKFGSDILSFAGPLLLNQVVQYLESNNHESTDGFYYALGLFFSTFLASILISLFNFYINNISIKIRSSVITSIYNKIFSVRYDTLNASFSTGEILNFASTDTDRVVNFCPSLLQLVSLPVQLSVTLYLLYHLLGLAFVTGVVFAVVLIPINRWICNKIGELSAKMMDWKDKRIKLMSETLMGIRVIKMHAWEDLFHKRIVDLRQQEVKYLKGRKYLDAFCVYFWATTPVLISSLVFGTFVLMNGKLTAPVVFTSLALLGMLIMPLNAFPWVLNGLMESWVSIIRLQKLFDLDLLELNKHYNAKVVDSSVKLEVVGASFKLDNSTHSCRFILGPIDLTVASRAFIGVIGSLYSFLISFVLIRFTLRLESKAKSVPERVRL